MVTEPLLVTWHRAIDSRLTQLIAFDADDAPRLQDSIRRSLLSQPDRHHALAFTTALHLLGRPVREVDIDIACAIEMISGAVTAIGGLACMVPGGDVRSTTPPQGEDISILAAVSMISEAFAVIARTTRLDRTVQVALINHLANATGSTHGGDRHVDDRHGDDHDGSALLQATLVAAGLVAELGEDARDSLGSRTRELLGNGAIGESPSIPSESTAILLSAVLDRLGEPRSRDERVDFSLWREHVSAVHGTVSAADA